ncbi:unnamed protein product [Symbiodinium natans]|uniref:Uncharacterized protein n=1 Tax=Symbiodinium natans TaxID=878477 RepID=A0A812S031_9DINO|nr:unnamed protein product [Symbiodinium natans]
MCLPFLAEHLRGNQIFFLSGEAWVKLQASFRSFAMKIRIYICVSLLSSALCVREPLPTDLPAEPEALPTQLPDLIEDVATSSLSKLVKRPALNPTPQQIQEEEKHEPGASWQRLRYFVSFLLLMYMATVIVGSVIMAIGRLAHQQSEQPMESTKRPKESAETQKESAETKPKNQTADRALSIKQERLLTQLVCAMVIGVCFFVITFSLDAGIISKGYGLNWEVYLLLFGTQCVWFLVQALIKACIETGPLPMYTFLRCSVALVPFIRNDACDILKEMILGGLLIQSNNPVAKLFGILAWAHIIVLRAYLCVRGRDS